MDITTLTSTVTSYYLQLYISLRDWLSALAARTGTPVVLILLVIAIAVLGGFLLLILLSILLQRLYNNRTSYMMRLLGDAFDLMMFGRDTAGIDEAQIRSVVQPKYFIYFERYLRNAVSSTGEYDTAGLRRISRVSGFTAFVEKRIRRQRGWDRALSLRTLSYLRDPEDIPVFRGYLKTSKSLPVIFASAIGAALCRDYDSVELAVTRVYRPEEPNRDQVLSILEAYGQGACPAVTELLNRGSALEDMVRVVLLDFLRIHNYREALPAVERVLGSTPSHEIRIHAIETLGVLGSPESCSLLKPYLEHEDFIIRLKALVALARLDIEKALPILEASLGDKDWWVRRNAGEALFNGGQKGLDLLQRVAKEPDTARGLTARMVVAEEAQQRKRLRYRYA